MPSVDLSRRRKLGSTATFRRAHRNTVVKRRWKRSAVKSGPKRTNSILSCTAKLRSMPHQVIDSCRAIELVPGDRARAGRFDSCQRDLGPSYFRLAQATLDWEFSWRMRAERSMPFLISLRNSSMLRLFQLASQMADEEGWGEDGTCCAPSFSNNSRRLSTSSGWLPHLWFVTRPARWPG